MGDDLVMDLDLNQEPFVDPPPPSSPPAPPSVVAESFLDELETSRPGVEDRLRQVEAVTARARQRHRWRQAMYNPELSYMSVIEPNVGVRNESQRDNGAANGGGDFEERVGGERGRNCKRDISQLAKALEMDLDAKKNDNGGVVDGDGDNGNFFDCNICLDAARDPILTCCGHLFCWACFYQVPYVDSIAKECPVCKGEVTDSNVTPIYGNGKNSQVLELESGVKIPPRPRAHRVDSVRQQRFSTGISHIPVADALRRIRIGLGLIEENPSPRGLNSVGPNSETIPLVLQNSEAEASRGARRFSRVISESAASLSSISSALNNAERFVEDLETYINNRHMRTDAQLRPAYHERDTSVADTTVDVQSEPLTGEMNPNVPVSSSSQRNLATTVLHLGTLATDSSVEIDLTISRPNSSSRRRRGVSRALNLEGEASLELRRRLLR